MSLSIANLPTYLGTPPMNINGDCLSYSNNVPSREIIEVFLLIDSVLGQSLPGMEPLLYIIYIIPRHSPAVTSNFLVPRESIMSIISYNIVLCLCFWSVQSGGSLLNELNYSSFMINLARSKQVNQVRSGLGQESNLRFTTFRISAISIFNVKVG